VRSIDLDEAESARLRTLGLREGAIVHVIHWGAFGGRVIAIGSDRLAIDGRTCAAIGVA
jgi:ferrous iron transport protein A